jgi:copper chaperone CopZ
MAATIYPVTGMTCEHCVHGVTAELASIPGVAGVTVELVPGGESLVTVTSDMQVPEDTVAAALAEAGDYQLGGARS